MEVVVKTKIRLGNSEVLIEENTSVIIFRSIQTDENNGSQVYGIYAPISDKDIYPMIYALIEQANDGNNSAKVLLQMFCTFLSMSHSVFPVDGEFVIGFKDLVVANYGRIKEQLDAVGREAGILPETEEEALAKLAEDEEMEKIAKENTLKT